MNDLSEESIDHVQIILNTYVVKNDKDELLREGADCWWDLAVYASCCHRCCEIKKMSMRTAQTL
ncbi:hypothetical protein PsorP6_014691 [Peronosclerospora sorghi]|uniref:Uncharacterized protein n=1 Tax=Peronosclerospora sorghi TaxID=230839 RepID=A0ACC0VUT6_9STRA|nr:hypothetical protein PsorP6_014691 [Peronosclerospora sorghi]